MFASIKIALRFMRGGYALRQAHEAINLAWNKSEQARKRGVITWGQHSKIIDHLGEARRLVESAMQEDRA